MNPAIKIAALGAAGATLFMGSYVGFAKVVGADMHRLVVVGNFFEPPPEEEEEAGLEEDEFEEPVEEGVASPKRSEEGLSQTLARKLRTPQRAASIIDFFTVQAPFTTEELKAVSDELLASADRLTAREREIRQREDGLEELQAKLDEDFATLLRLQSALDAQASELRQREAEINRDVGVKIENESLVHEKIGELFLEGDPEELVPRLSMFEPREAAKILSSLPPERANQLIGALKTEADWLEYAEAYALRSAEVAATKKKKN